MKMSPEINAGQAVYTPRTLSLAYDAIVLGISNFHIWKCPTPEILAHYNQHLTSRHLDVGVGTGYYLDNCDFPTGNPELVLMDINTDCLTHTQNRIARFCPETVQANVLEPIAYPGDRFDSIAATYLLHCLPGNMAEKSILFDHLSPLLKPGGVIFGATIVSGENGTGWLAAKLMQVYNRRGIFCNAQDTADSLAFELRSRFSSVSIRTVGCVALFSARG